MCQRKLWKWQQHTTKCISTEALWSKLTAITKVQPQTLPEFWVNGSVTQSQGKLHVVSLAEPDVLTRLLLWNSLNPMPMHKYITFLLLVGALGYLYAAVCGICNGLGCHLWFHVHQDEVKHTVGALKAVGGPTENLYSILLLCTKSYIILFILHSLY